MFKKSGIAKLKILLLSISLGHNLWSMEERGAPQFCVGDVEDDWCMVDLQQAVKQVQPKKDPLVVQAQNLCKAVEQAQEVYAKEKDMFFVLMRRTSPNFCEEVEEALVNNFQNTDIDHKQVYRFIGLTLVRAKNMPHTRILKCLNSRHKAGKLTDRQRRQLEYPFKTAQSKEEYDMFCQGRLAELMLDQKTAQAMREKFSKITSYGLKLADLEDFSHQLQEIFKKQFLN